MTATHHQDTMLRARKIALSSGLDWPRKLGAAQTLSQSANPDDTALARHIRDAYSLDLQGLLKEVDPTHRDKSDRVDAWREAIKLTEQPETSDFDEAREYRKQLAVLTLGGLAVIALVVAGVV